MAQHPWEQIISEYYLSGLTKGKFFSQYNKAHPEEKICLSTFYNKLVFFEELLREATSAPTESEPCKIAESFSEPSVLDGDLVNIIEIKPETLAQEQSRSFITSSSVSGKFDTIVIRAPGGISITLPTENGLADLSILLNNLVRSLQ